MVSFALADVLSAHAGPSDPGPELTATRWLTGWTVEPVPLAAIAIVGVLYLSAARRLRTEGHPWSPARTWAFVGGGLGSMVVALASPLATYDTVLLSVHMAQHMILSMVAPIFLALGAPITLALRTLPARPRRWLLAVLHSRAAAVLTFPVVAGVIFVVNPFVLYFSGLYEQTLERPWLHDLNHVHFVLVGCLWYFSLLAIDPLPRRPGYPLRVIAAFITLPFHAWLGVAIMSMNTLIAQDWYLGQGRDWGASPMSDQRLAGGLLWSAGDIVGLLVFAALFRGWVRSSEREARREDRRLDRLEAAARAAAEPVRAADVDTIAAVPTPCPDPETRPEARRGGRGEANPRRAP